MAAKSGQGSTELLMELVTGTIGACHTCWPQCRSRPPLAGHSGHPRADRSIQAAIRFKRPLGTG